MKITFTGHTHALGRAVVIGLLSCSALAGEVTIDGYSFKPEKITVQAGETVTWTSDASSRHTVVVEDKESRRLQRGSTFSHTFTSPGEYPYRCGVHRSMKGVVVVEGEPKVSAAVQGAVSTVSTSVSVSSAGPTHAMKSGAPNVADSDEAKIMIVDFMRFEPTEITVEAGTTVVFENHDGSNHIILFDDKVKSQRLRHDAAYSRTFDQPGDYPFICAIHGKRMSGTVHVTP